MIVINRRTASEVSTVMRKLPCRGSPQPTTVEIQAGRDGLCFRSATPEVAIEYREAGRRPPGRIVLPVEAFADFRGRQGEVILKPSNDGGTVARWDDSGVPRTKEYPPSDIGEAFPQAPRRFTSQSAGFITAMREAVSMTGEAARYAMHRIRLRGEQGDLAATDGRTLLIQGGFNFPWSGDLLASATRVFTCQEFIDREDASVGVNDTHVCLRVGLWTVWLAIDSDGRFPPVEDVVRSASTGEIECRFSETDTHFLISALSSRRAKSDPLTIALENGGVAIRASQEGSDQTMEWCLEDSSCEGSAVTVVCERSHLIRMLTLGFRSLRISRADAPVMFRESDRTFVWMPLDSALTLPHDPGATRFHARPTTESTKPRTSTSKATMNRRHQDERRVNGQTGGKGDGSGVTSLLAEAESLKADLREAYSRAVRLVDALKRQRRQSRLVRSTLESLKQLPNIE